MGCAWLVPAMACASAPPEPPVPPNTYCEQETILRETYRNEGQGAYSYAVKGCGRTDVLAHRKDGSWTSLRETAGADFTCSPRELDVAVMNRILFAVAGCGKSATYSWVPGGGFVRVRLR